MRINGRVVRLEKRVSLAEIARRFHPGADMAVVNGRTAPHSAWGEFFPSDGDAVAFMQKGVMPEPRLFLELLQSRNHPGVVEKLSGAVAGIAGCGGLGSHAALALARMGIGKVVLADCDIVEPSNLNRQAYFAADIGKAKTLALKELLCRVNPVIEVETHTLLLDRNNSGLLFAKCDVILECLDQAEAKSMFVEEILSLETVVPLVAASGLGGLDDANTIVTKEIRPGFWLVGDQVSEAVPEQGLAAPRVMVAAGHQALCAARILIFMK